jgi:DNA-binding PadR family transcriptional regulator
VGHVREQPAGNTLLVDHGSLYPALQRLENRGWIRGAWGTSENNRRARFYAITRSGRRRLATEETRWRVASETILRFLAPPRSAS